MTDADLQAALPPGKTLAEALHRARAKRDALWDGARFEDDVSEDDLLVALERFCVRLCQGSLAAGAELATRVIYGEDGDK